MAALSIVAVDDQCERRLLGWVLELGAKIDHVIP